MSIRFACESCGHPFEVGDQVAGKRGHCKHCGAMMTIPAAPGETSTPPHAEPGLRLRPVEDHEPAAPSPVAVGPALRVRLVEEHDPAPAASHPAPNPSDEQPIKVLDPYHFAERQAHRVKLNPHYELRIAREAARFFRKTRDRLYLLSLAFLVLTLVAFLFQQTKLLHLATVGVVASNALMLVDGLLYLVVIPFRESFAEGIGATIFPPYHWIRHWDRMKHPFLSTVRSFVPVVLAGVIWFGYEERGQIKREFEQVEGAVERKLGIAEGPARPGPKPPGVIDEATKALGGESNLIQQLAQPQ